MGIFKTDIPTPAPPPADPRLKELEEAEKQRLAKIRRGQAGRAGTILTSALGITSEPTLAKKTLLGE